MLWESIPHFRAVSSIWLGHTQEPQSPCVRDRARGTAVPTGWALRVEVMWNSEGVCHCLLRRQRCHRAFYLLRKFLNPRVSLSPPLSRFHVVFCIEARFLWLVSSLLCLRGHWGFRSQFLPLLLQAQWRDTLALTLPDHLPFPAGCSNCDVQHTLQLTASF